jgi:hypothetical protein
MSELPRGRTDAPTAPATWTTWRQREEDGVFVGLFTDYKGHRASVFVQAKTLDRVWVLDHDPAEPLSGVQPATRIGDPATLRGIRPGTRGRLHMLAIHTEGEADDDARAAARGTEAAIEDATFLDFAPRGGRTGLGEIVRRVETPWMLGLLAGQDDARARSLEKIARLRAPRERTAVVAGMLTAGAYEAVGLYLSSFEFLRGEGERELPDFRVIAPWLIHGFDDAPIPPYSDDEARHSPVRYLLPAVRVWQKTHSRDATARALRESLRGKPAGDLVPLRVPPPRGRDAGGHVRPANGPFDRGAFPYADVLRHRAPEFYAVVEDVCTHLVMPTRGEATYALDIVDDDQGKALVYLITPGATFARARLPEGPAAPIPFGSRVELTCSTLDRWAIDPRYAIEWISVGAVDGSSVVEALKRSSSYAALGHLGRAAEASLGGFTWEDWRLSVKERAELIPHEIVWVDSNEILCAYDAPPMADRMRELLPRMVTMSVFDHRLHHALRVVAAYLKHDLPAKARALLDELPALLFGATAIGSAERLALGAVGCNLVDAFGALVERVQGRKTRALTIEERAFVTGDATFFRVDTACAGRALRARWIGLLLDPRLDEGE